MNTGSVSGLSGLEALEALAEMAELITSNTSSKGTLAAALRTITEMFNGEGALLWILDEKNQCLARALSYHTGDRPHSKAFEQQASPECLKFGEELAGEAWARGDAQLLQQPAMFAQTPAPGNEATTDQTKRPAVNTFAFPLYAGGTIYGAIVIVDCSLQTLEKETRTFFRVVGTMLGAFAVASLCAEKVQNLGNEISEITAYTKSVENELRETKGALSGEYAGNVRDARYTQQMLRKISQEIRTPLNGIVGAVELLQRNIDGAAQQSEYVAIIKHSSEVLTKVLEELVEFADNEQSFAPLTSESASGGEAQDSGNDKNTEKIQRPRAAWDATSVAAAARRESLKKLALSTQEGVVPAESNHPRRKVATDLATARVLVVAGLIGSAEFIEPYLISAGVKCSTSSRGYSALTKMKQAALAGRNFDLVFVEMVLPDMTAYEFATAVHQDPSLSASSLILVSTFGAGPADNAAFRQVFADHIAKPVKQAQVISAASAVLAGEVSGTTMLTPAQEQAALPSAAEQGERLILIAEDNPVNQRVALLQLKELGFYAKAVTNGQEALDAMQESPFSAVLMDCQMPLMDGYETTRKIRELEKTSGTHIPIIAMTAHALAADRENCFAVGMDDYLSKPVTYDRLNSVLSRWVDVGHNKNTGEKDMAETAEPNRELRSFVPDMPAATPPLDVTQLEEMLGSEETAEILQLFVSSTEDLLQRIDKAMVDHDAKALREAAHELKGACSSVGASGMAQSCLELEQVAKENDWEKAPAIQSGLTQTFESTRSYINNIGT